MSSPNYEEEIEARLLEKLFDLNDAIELLKNNGEINETMRRVIIAALESEIEATIASIKLGRVYTDKKSSITDILKNGTRLHS